MIFANPTAGRIQAQSEPWDGTSIRVTRTCADHLATRQGCALDLGDGKCTRPVLAIGAGTVTFRDVVQGIIRIDHGGGWQSDYAHMNPLLVDFGGKVTRGQQIGEIGDAHSAMVTNFSGCHLHFGILLNGVEQDPWLYLNATMEGDMPGYKIGSNIGTFKFVGSHSLISSLDTRTVYPQAANAGPWDVAASLDLKRADGTPIDIDGQSPPRNNRDQVYLVDAPGFGIAALALRQDGVFIPTEANADTIQAQWEAWILTHPKG